MDNVPYSKELVDGLVDTHYDSVVTYFTIDMLTKFKDTVYKDKLHAFVWVCVDCCIAGDRINFINVPSKNKDTLIEGCVNNCVEPVKGRLIAECLRPFVLLKPKLFASE